MNCNCVFIFIFFWFVRGGIFIILYIALVIDGQKKKTPKKAQGDRGEFFIDCLFSGLRLFQKKFLSLSL